MLINKTSLFVSLTAASAALAAAPAAAQVSSIAPFHKTADLLIADAAGGRILRAADVDNDGLYNGALEVSLYFDPQLAINPATGFAFGSILTNPSILTIDRRGDVYIVANGSNTIILRLHDDDGDGAAMGPGEASVYFNSNSLPSIFGAAVNGAVFDWNDELYITADGPAFDYVIKLKDNNNDGDVNDPGEAAIVYDDSVAASNGNPPLFNVAWAGFIPGGSLYITNASFFHKFTVKFSDAAPANGQFHDSGEVIPIYSSANGNPAQGAAKCARFAKDGKLYIYNTQTKNLIVTSDNNFNGIYDGAGEGGVFASTGQDGIFISSGSQFDIRSDGAVLFADFGAASRIILWKDNNNDGDALDAGESAEALTFANSAFPFVDPRALCFLPAEPSNFGGVRASNVQLKWNREGGLPKVGNLNFSLILTNAPVGAAVGIFYSDSQASQAFDSFIPGYADPNCYLWINILSPDSGLIDPGVGLASNANTIIPFPLPSFLDSVAGNTYYIQAIAVDLNLNYPVVLSDGLSIPIL